MINLNDEIIAYLTVNNINFIPGDYQTGIPEGGVDQILIWNIEALGQEPTQDQLDSAYPIWLGQQVKAQNKQQASTLLSQTDWTATIDISNPQYSNPYLDNQDEFLAYRSSVRNIAVNPPTIPAVFPIIPSNIWKTV